MSEVYPPVAVGSPAGDGTPVRIVFAHSKYPPIVPLSLILVSAWAFELTYKPEIDILILLVSSFFILSIISFQSSSLLALSSFSLRLITNFLEPESFFISVFTLKSLRPLILAEGFIKSTHSGISIVYTNCESNLPKVPL